MTYHTDNKIRIYVKGYGFMSFAKNLGSKHGQKIMNKGISAASKFNQSKYGKTLKKEGSKFLKTSGQRALEKADHAVRDYIGSKIANKLTSSLRVSEKPQEVIEEEEIIIPPDKRQQILNDLRLFQYKMGYNKITNLLGKLDKDELPKFTTIKWIEIFDQSNGTYNPNKDIRFKTPQIRDNLCDFNDAYIVVTGKANATNAIRPNDIDINANAVYSRKVALKNSAPFFNCVLKINKQ